MNGVQELTGLRVVADLTTQLTGDLSLQRLVVGGGNAYLLDGKKGRVVSVTLGAPEGEAKEVLQEGDLVGMAKAARPSPDHLAAGRQRRQPARRRRGRPVLLRASRRGTRVL